MSEIKLEPLVDPQNDRSVLRPIKYPDIFKFKKMQESVFWTSSEIDQEYIKQQKRDSRHYNEATENEKHFIRHILCFFAESDEVVSRYLVLRVINQITVPEAQHVYKLIAAIEDTHSDTYGILLEICMITEDQMNDTIKYINNCKAIQNKNKWAKKWIQYYGKDIQPSSEQKISILLNNADTFNKDINEGLATRILAFAIVEGIFFSGSFCAIYWLKSQNKYPTITFANDLISRDEGIHVDYAVFLYNNYIINKLPEETVFNMIKEAVQLEKEFIIEALPCRMIGMDSNKMCQYIEYCADRLLESLNYNKIYNVEQPFPFMENISLRKKSNFFERSVSEYSKGSLNDNTVEEGLITFD